MTGKTKVGMAMLGFILSVSGLSWLKGDGLEGSAKEYAHKVFWRRIGHLTSSDILSRWGSCSVKGAKDDMEPYKIGYKVGYTADHWHSFLGTGLPRLGGLLPLRADACVSDKIEKSIIGKGESAKHVREYLEFLTAPRFACVFFPLEMFRKVFSKSTNVYGECECNWNLRGELNCDVVRKKFKKDSKYFKEFGKYTFYLVSYEEKLSGCIFEMFYFFGDDGMLIGWFPSKLMTEFGRHHSSDRSEFWCFCRIARNPLSTHSFSMKDFE